MPAWPLAVALQRGSSETLEWYQQKVRLQLPKDSPGKERWAVGEEPEGLSKLTAWERPHRQLHRERGLGSGTCYKISKCLLFI